MGRRRKKAPQALQTPRGTSGFMCCQLMRQQSLSTSSEWLACRYFMEHQTAREKALLCALWQTSTLGGCVFQQ